MADAIWTDRQVRGPTAEFFTAEQFRNLFTPVLSEDLFETKSKEGAIPPPIRLSQRNILYSWKHVVFFLLWMDLFGIQQTLPKETGKKD